jgi:hypothetical protein
VFLAGSSQRNRPIYHAGCLLKNDEEQEQKRKNILPQAFQRHGFEVFFFFETQALFREIARLGFEVCTVNLLLLHMQCNCTLTMWSGVHQQPLLNVAGEMQENLVIHFLSNLEKNSTLSHNIDCEQITHPSNQGCSLVHAQW